MSTALIVANTVPKTQSAYTLAKMHERIRGMCPADLDREAFIAACLTEANNLPDDVDPVTVAKTAIRAATVGLIPGDALGHCYFVAFRNNKRNCRECQLIIGYRGYQELAFSSGWLANVFAEVVCQGEQWEHWVDTSGPQVRHVPDLNRNVSRENVIAAYCVYRTTKQSLGVQVVSRQELDKVDKRKDVWREDYAAMAKKTAVIRASKYWQQTRRLATAVLLHEQVERQEPQQLPGEEPVDVEVTDEPGVALDALGEE